MGLGSEVINLCRPDLCDQSHQIAGICGICIVKKKFHFIVIGIDNMVDTGCIADAVSANQSVYLISLFQQEFRKIRTILSCNTCNQRYVLHNDLLLLSVIILFLSL